MALPSKPKPPSRVWAYKRTSNSITIRWRAGSAPAGRYAYIIKVNGKHRAAYKRSGTRQFLVRGLKAKTSYRISVQVKDKLGRYSARREIRVRTRPPPPRYSHPLAGARTTSPYGPRGGTMHKGVDLVKSHNYPIRAVMAGTVVQAGSWSSGYGISVMIKHSNGDYSHYAHLNSKAVNKGQSVKVGQTIGRQGNTGDSTGSHLHFEIHKDRIWNQVNPVSYMGARGIRL